MFIHEAPASSLLKSEKTVLPIGNFYIIVNDTSSAPYRHSNPLTRAAAARYRPTISSPSISPTSFKHEPSSQNHPPPAPFLSSSPAASQTGIPESLSPNALNPTNTHDVSTSTPALFPPLSTQNSPISRPRHPHPAPPKCVPPHPQPAPTAAPAGSASSSPAKAPTTERAIL